MGFLKISVLQLVSSLSDFLFYFSLQKNNNNKSFLFRHSSISYLRNRKLTLGCYLNINPKNWKLKTKFSIFIFKKWIFTIILFFNIQNLTWKLDSFELKIGVKINFQWKNAMENWLDEIYTYGPSSMYKTFIWFSIEFFDWKMNFDPIFNSI